MVMGNRAAASAIDMHWKPLDLLQVSQRSCGVAAALTVEEAAQAADRRAAVDAALDASTHSIRGAHYAIGSQQHFYMEPQVTLYSQMPKFVMSRFLGEHMFNRRRFRTLFGSGFFAMSPTWRSQDAC
jgi:hypothetical protein